MIMRGASILLAVLTYHEVIAASPLFQIHSAGATIWGVEKRVSLWNGRGGGDADTMETLTEVKEELSLDGQVHAAMRRLGLSPSLTESESKETEECEGGACALPSTSIDQGSIDATGSLPNSQNEQVSVHAIAEEIAKDMKVNKDIALAALGATAEMLPGDERKFDESAARKLVQQELDMIGRVSEDSEQVEQLISEGFDPFLCRRALAFAEMNMDDARAILIADREDEEEEAEAAKVVEVQVDEEAQMRARLREEAEAKKAENPKNEMKTVSVDANFDPTVPMGNAAPPAGLTGLGSSSSSSEASMKPPSPAKKADVVFDATADQVQELVLESPVPVLLDVYADWCGPCKALTPALEDMAVKAGGIFRLVKINTDTEKAISGALEVTSLPTVYGIKDGKVINMFEGMPRSEGAVKNFMMGLLMPGNTFDPPVTAEQTEKYNELSSKLTKAAGTACFSFAARERMQDRMATKLSDLVEAYNGNMADAEDSAKVMRSLMSNIVRNPYDIKFRKVNLQNKVIAAKIGSFSSCLSILKSVGFASDGSNGLIMGKNKKVVNVAPLLIARDCIDKWIDRNRYLIAAATRKRKDDIDRVRLAAEKAATPEEEEEDAEEEEEEVDPNACTLKLRLDGKNKVHEVVMNADEPLSAVIATLPMSVEDGQEVQFICTAKRLVVKSTDEHSMTKTLREYGLVPTAAIVIKISREEQSELPNTGPGKLAERAAAKKKQKKGSHTMQSIGVYAKDDNNKAELIDGGGDVLYEHDVSDDEVEEEEEEVAEHARTDEDSNESQELGNEEEDNAEEE